MRCCCSLSSFRLPGRSHAGTHSYCRRVAGVDSTHVIPWKIKCTQFTLCKSQCSAQPLSAIPGCWSAVFSATGAFLATCRLVHRLARDEHVSGSISNGTVPLAHPISVVCLQPISPFPAIAMKHWIPFYPFSARALQRCCCTCEKKKKITSVVSLIACPENHEMASSCYLIYPFRHAPPTRKPYWRSFSDENDSSGGARRKGNWEAGG